MSVRRPAGSLKYEVIELFDYPVLFTPSRIDRESLPKGMYLYEVRHDDESKGEIAEIAHRIMINFWGTIITDKRIKLIDDDYRYIDEDKDVKEIDLTLSLNEYKNINSKKDKGIER